ncbi:MAG: hypothetical protein ACRDF7_00895 [Candidatus Limnocylindrales bacterium]
MYDVHYRLIADRQARLRAEADARRVARTALDARKRANEDQLPPASSMVGRRGGAHQNAVSLAHCLAPEHGECQPSH